MNIDTLANLIKLREYINISINNMYIAKDKMRNMSSALAIIDTKLIEFISSPDFESFLSKEMEDDSKEKEFEAKVSQKDLEMFKEILPAAKEDKDFVMKPKRAKKVV